MVLVFLESYCAFWGVVEQKSVGCMDGVDSQWFSKIIMIIMFIMIMTGWKWEVSSTPHNLHWIRWIVHIHSCLEALKRLLSSALSSFSKDSCHRHCHISTYPHLQASCIIDESLLSSTVKTSWALLTDQVTLATDLRFVATVTTSGRVKIFPTV